MDIFRRALRRAAIGAGDGVTDPRRRRALLTLLAASCLPLRATATESSGTLAVVYPEIDNPFKSFFDSIVSGAEQASRLPVITYTVPAGMQADALVARLRRGGTKAVILLGRKGVTMGSAIGAEFPVVTSGFINVPESELRGMTAVSLTPDPDLLFARLKALLPGIRRVLAVYDPHYNDWLMRRAREAAAAQGLELARIEANSLAAAARAYESALANGDGHRDALWLTSDWAALQGDTLLPFIVKTAWDRGIPVFSSTLAHVKNGVLFALYPNPVELGKALAATALGSSADGYRRGLVPLRQVGAAINVRMAAHLDIPVGTRTLSHFNLVFPIP